MAYYTVPAQNDQKESSSSQPIVDSSRWHRERFNNKCQAVLGDKARSRGRRKIFLQKSSSFNVNMWSTRKNRPFVNLGRTTPVSDC